jgi:hypothetical protein
VASFTSSLNFNQTFESLSNGTSYAIWSPLATVLFPTSLLRIKLYRHVQTVFFGSHERFSFWEMKTLEVTDCFIFVIECGCLASCCYYKFIVCWRDLKICIRRNHFTGNYARNNKFWIISRQIIKILDQHQSQIYKYRCKPMYWSAARNFTKFFKSFLNLENFWSEKRKNNGRNLSVRKWARTSLKTNPRCSESSEIQYVFLCRTNGGSNR